MRAVVVFTPCANPTYMPLGLAALCEFMKGRGLDALVGLDLNIATWNWLVEREPLFMELRAFMKGTAGNFYDRLEYESHLGAWSQIAGKLEEYTAAAKKYLEDDELGLELRLIFEFWAAKMLANDPELIAFSVMYPGQVLLTLAAAKYVSKLDHGVRRIVVGGATVSALDDEEILTTCPFVDAVFSGEGELGFAMLCEGSDFSQIPGLCYRNHAGGFSTNRKPDTVSLSCLQNPSFDCYDVNAYFNPEPVIPVVFSRGCKWRKCRFCAHNFSYSGYRRMNVENFVEYLAMMNARLGARNFYFADQYIDSEDLYLISDEIVRRGLDVTYHVMGRPTESYTSEVLEKLYAGGCRWISWGVETGSQRLLDLCMKGTKVETVRRIIKDAHATGISNLPMMIFGLPQSDDTALAETLELLDELNDYCDDVTTSSFQLWDKTAFGAAPEKYGLKVTQREKLFTNKLGTLHSIRLFYQEKSADGSWRPGRGSMEIAQYERRMRWSGQKTIYDGLTCEHYLLYASHIRRGTGGDITLRAS